MTALYTHRKKLILIIFIVIFAFIVRTILLRDPSTEPVYIVERKDLIDKVDVSGTYELGMQKEITSTSTGIITSLYVKNGDFVEEDDDLFDVESTATEEEKAAALSAYQTALANLNIAKSNLRAKEAAVDKVYDDVQGNENTETFAQRDTRTTAEAARDNAYYALQSAQAAFTKARLDYLATEDITITAPVSGEVANLLKKEGDSIRSVQGVGANQIPAETVMYIANFDNPYLMVSINESYLPRIKQSLPVKIVFDSLPDEEFMGSIDSFETISSNVSGVVSYKARIDVNDPDNQLLSGMTAVATIETFRKENVITIPNSAIIERGGEMFVRRSNNEPQRIQIGYQGISETEVLSGLNEGDEIYANPELQ